MLTVIGSTGFSADPGVVKPGLVLYLDAGDSGSYPGSGASWTDLSGASRTGTLTNGPTFSSANGGSIVFDGTNDFVDTSNFIANSSLKTMSCWVKFSTFTGTAEIMSKSSDCRGVELILFNSNISFYVMDCVNFTNRFTAISVATSTLSTNTWYFINAVHDGPSSTMTLYFNAESKATGTAPSTINNANLNFRLGAWNDIGRYFNGNIAMALCYNRALTAAEVAQNFNATRGRFGV